MEEAVEEQNYGILCAQGCVLFDYSIYNVNRWQIEVVQHSFTLQDRHNRISSKLPVFATRSRSSVHARHPFILFLAITVSALFVHYRGKNGSADIMAAFHTQKRLGGVFITILPFKNILWSNHISSTTLPYGIHVINN